MPRPRDITHPGEYFRWVEDVIAAQGGYVHDVVGKVFPGGAGGRLPRTDIDFYDGGVVSARFVLDSRLELVTYSFHYRVLGEFCCRLDRHEGHEQQDGGPCHIHLPGPAGGATVREPTDAFDFDEALAHVRAFDPRE